MATNSDREPTAATAAGGDGAERDDAIGGGEGRVTLRDVGNNFYRDLREFMFANSVLSAAAGFSIGSATNKLIQDLMDMVLFPIMKAVGGVLMSSIPANFVERAGALFDVGRSTIMFASIVLLTFVLLEYLINKEILGLRTRVRTGNASDFAMAKVAAQMRTIIPTKESVEEANRDDLADMVKGIKTIQAKKRSADQELEVAAAIAVKPNTNDDDDDRKVKAVLLRVKEQQTEASRTDAEQQSKKQSNKTDEPDDKETFTHPLEEDASSHDPRSTTFVAFRRPTQLENAAPYM